MAVTSQIFLLLSFLCISICYSEAEKVQKWGDCDNFVLVGRERISEWPQPFRPRSRVIKFPPGFHKPNFIIRGINHKNLLEVEPKVTVVDGKIGERRIWLKIESQLNYGIESVFEFCGEIAEV